MTSAGSTPAPADRGMEGPPVVTLRLFAAARQAAGTGEEKLAAATVGEALEQARERFGESFSAVLEGSRVWLNGEPTGPSQALVEGDELAVLPPVSGG